ncbi:MAG: uroporphyrinogen-III C-methyltransferase [Flavobacteriaceae bacterium]|nr:uroporphyrinogen-III C-methyltransferase [Flavobacteriaceae bacterium]
MKPQPKITLVGAGPGDPELMTLKGIRALQSAQVVLYDALIDKSLLELTPADCQKIFVGKRKHFKAFTQDEINQLLVDFAQNFGHVVRLKGGDPFVFGRGSEELLFAEKHGIETSVIPGISSAVSVPQSAGIPLTHRTLSSSFWVVTATNLHGELTDDLRLAAQSSATVVILMGASKLPEIASLFMRLGKSDMPVAVIQNGTTKAQRSVVGSIQNIVGKAKAASMGSPAVIVVGEVVRLYKVPEMRQMLATCV